MNGSDEGARTGGPGGAVVVGAGRGLGRGIAGALADAGLDVLAIARTPGDLTTLAAGRPQLSTLTADATDESVAMRVVAEQRPAALVLVAGAVPGMGTLAEQTWESFAVNWEVDVRLTFAWLRAVLRTPPPPGSRIVVVSSGAALNGSPASGGYAGAKATQRFLATYARAELEQAGADLSVVTLLPGMTPHGAIGRAGIAAYARRAGRPEADFVRDLGPLLTPDLAGAAVVDLLRTPRPDLADEYLLASGGAQPLAPAAGRR